MLHDQVSVLQDFKIWTSLSMLPDTSTFSLRHIIHCDAESTFLSKVRYHKNSSQLPKPCHVGIHVKALSEPYQMSTHMPGLLLFSHFSNYFVLYKSATSSQRFKRNALYSVFCNPFGATLSLVFWFAACKIVTSEVIGFHHRHSHG